MFVCLQSYTTGTAASHFDFVFLSTFFFTMVFYRVTENQF